MPPARHTMYFITFASKIVCFLEKENVFTKIVYADSGVWLCCQHLPRNTFVSCSRSVRQKHNARQLIISDIICKYTLGFYSRGFNKISQHFTALFTSKCDENFITCHFYCYFLSSHKCTFIYLIMFY